MQQQLRSVRICGASSLVLALLCLAPGVAHAQYKNNQFGIGGGVLVLAPANNTNYEEEARLVDPVDGSAPAGGTSPLSVNGIPNDSCNGSRWPCGLPYRALNPIVNFWYASKLSDDSHWWFSGALNLALLGSISDPSPRAGTKFALNGDTMVLIEPMGGPRFYILTDTFRPFVELGIRLGFVAGAPAGIPTKLQILPGIYGMVGLEFMVARDISLVVSGRYTFLVIINFHEENMFEGNAGIAFYF